MAPATWDVTGGIFRDVVDCISDGVVVADLSGVVRFANRAFCDMVGYSGAELVGHGPPFQHWPEELHSEMTEALHGALTGNASDLELVYKRRSGERFDVLVHPAMVTSEGRTVAVVATIKEISERRRMERELRQSQERWRSVAENPFDFVVTLDRNYVFTYVNHTAPGIRAEDLIGKATPFDFTEPEYHDVMRRTFERAFEFGEPGSYDLYVPLLERWISTIVGPIFEDGSVTGISMLTRDCTSQKQAEQALRQSQRMEALGRLAGGIAHDFNNLLVPILGNASLLEASVSPGSDESSLLDDIIRAAERAKELVSRVLIFGREASVTRQPVRVQEIAEEVASFVRAGAPASVEVVTHVDPECPAVDGVPGEVHQIIANLCTNAVQALGGAGGQLSLTVAQARLSDGSAVLISVKDTGPGIEDWVLARIFEPFFTTRLVGEGTGLGLSIVQAIATRYGGSVHVSSKPGAGAQFDVLLPALASDPVELTPKTARREAPAGPACRALCIDDEPLVLRLLARVLTRAGHSVRTFSDALAAAEYLEEHATEVDCLITDQSMPFLSGTELARKAEKFAPSLPFLLLSGYPDQVPESLPKNIRCFIQKPVDAAVLLESLSRALANEGPA